MSAESSSNVTSVSDSPTVQPSGRGAAIRRVVIPIVSLVAIVFAGMLLWNSSHYEETDNAQIDGHIIAISPHISGLVAQVTVRDGQQVKQGDLLVVLDKRDYAVNVSQARASLSDGRANAVTNKINVPITSVSTRGGVVSARANLQSAVAGLNVTRQSLEAARANVDQAQANADRSEADLTRYRQLVAHEDVSRQQYEQALATEKTNQAQLASSKANLNGAEQAVVQAELHVEQTKADYATAQTAPQQVAATRARAESAAAQAEQRKALLEQAELNLSYTEIRAPRDGIIGKKTVEVGQNVVTGQQLMELVPTDDIWVTANFKETQLRNMQPGQPVEVSVDAYSKTYHGTVTSIGGATGDRFSLLPPENATGNYVKVVQRIPVRIDFDAADIADKKLRPGMSVLPKVRIQ